MAEGKQFFSKENQKQTKKPVVPGKGAGTLLLSQK